MLAIDVWMTSSRQYGPVSGHYCMWVPQEPGQKLVEMLRESVGLNTLCPKQLTATHKGAWNRAVREAEKLVACRTAVGPA